MKRLFSELKQTKAAFRKECEQDVPGIIRARTYAGDLLNLLSKHLRQGYFPETGWFMAAVGGFGRGDLSFASDLDLVFVHRHKLSSDLKRIIEWLIRGLWDQGFEVGHTVSTASQLKQLMDTDFSVRTAYLETRFICGDRNLYAAWRGRVEQNASRKNQRIFLETLDRSRKNRVERYAGSIYILEPHIKEGLGGLRDLHALRWIGVLLFGSPGSETFVRQGKLTAQELHWLEQAQDFVWRVRLQLHALHGRRKDRLLLQDQKELAANLNFVDGEQGVAAVEVFMRRYYRQTARIRRVTDFLLEGFLETSSRSSQKSRQKILPGPFILEGEHIHFHDPELVRSNPRLLMRIFWQAARSGAHFHHESGQVIRQNLDVFQRDFQTDIEMAECFLDILVHPTMAYRVLKVMMETGFLEAYLPEFTDIRYRVQYDLYHIYTVDEHLLKTVQELHGITAEGGGDAEKRGAPDTRVLFGRISQQRVLFLGALIHDVGKGHGQGHAARGARMARDVAVRLHLSARESELLTRVVELHLLLAETALKRDLFDEKPIERCAYQIGDQELLFMLYLLTVSDSRATGPQVWNSWRRSLINELFFKVEKMLDRKPWVETDVNSRLAECRDVLRSTLQDAAEAEKVLAWLEGLSFRYLLARNPREFYRHYELEKQLEQQTLGFDVRPHDGQIWEVTFVCYDRPQLFDMLTGVFWAYGINILSADIYTRDYGVAVDILLVDQIPDPLHPEALWRRIEKDLAAILKGDKTLAALLKKSRPDRVGAGRPMVAKADKVVIDEQASDFYTVIEVYTWERTGVLHTISKVLHAFDLSIQLAKISTPGAQVVDVFYVTDANQGKILDPGLHAELEQALLQALQT